MKRVARLLALAASSAVAIAAGGAVAADSKVTVVNAPVKLDAMKVVRDKETGRLRAATAEEIAEMNQATGGYAPNAVVLNRPMTTVVTRADGSATIRRSLDDMDSVVANRTVDGKLVIRHGDKHAPAAPAQSLPKE